MEAWLRDHADRLGASGRTSSTSRPSGGRSWSRDRSRGSSSAELTDAPLDREAFPPLGVRELTRGGRSRAARSGAGSSGEVCFELHHPRSRGPELWAALVGGRRRVRARVRMVSTRSRSSGSRRDTSTSGRTRSRTTRRRSSGSTWAVLPGKQLRGIPRARAPRGSLDRSEARRPRVRSRGRGAPRRAVADRRADPGEGDLGGSEPDPGAHRSVSAGSGAIRTAGSPTRSTPIASPLASFPRRSSTRRGTRLRG